MKSNSLFLSVSLALALIFTGCSKDEVEKDKKIPLTSIAVTPLSVSLTVNNTMQLTATPDPEDASDVSFEWSSDDPLVASVSATGWVTAKKAGSTTVKVKSGSVEASVPVTVQNEPIALTDITIEPADDNIDLQMGDKQQLTVTLVPADATDITVTYASDTESVATVSLTGEITAVNVGTATITVQAGSITKTLTVTITVSTNDPNDPEKNNWTVTTSSNFADWDGAKAIDGLPGSQWHSAASGQTLPQWIIVDMKAPKNIDGFLFTNRQGKTEPNHPKHITFEIGNDGTTWETALDIAELPNLYQQQILPLTNKKIARYFKVTIHDSWASGAIYSYIAELDIYVGTAPTPNPGPEADDTGEKNWEAEVSSALSDGVSGSALFDGSIDACWHSSVGDAQPWAIIDFKESKTINGIRFTGRQGGPGDVASSPKHIIFSVSTDKSNWQPLYEAQELPNLRTEQVLAAVTPQTGKYLKIDIQSTWNAAPYSYIGEIDIFEGNKRPEVPETAPAGHVYYPLAFTTIANNVDYTQDNGFVTLKTTGDDPWIHTTAFGAPFVAGTAKLTFEYKSNRQVTNGQFFWCVDGNPAPGKNTADDVVVEQASDWTLYEFDLSSAISSFSFGSSEAHFIRFDLTGNAGYEISIRKFRVDVTQ
ncbi:hypothetical protein EZS27_004537 [termite gut metagenome]|uniref:F5/8 type C domain-containing protein n=1 Tax=termite gut metagenome TaxID=433724 RepID=A0A5J4SRW9_9ZZZZ